MDEMTTVALVPEGTTIDRALNLGNGGLGGSDMREIAALLARAYPEAVLVVELPLWRPEDPGIRETDLSVAISGDEIYSVRPLNSGPNLVERTLRLADPSFMYNAFILEPKVNLVAELVFPNLLKSGQVVVKGVLVGAYDGEGFVLASSRH
ncbi:hypothetical protein ACTMTJ_32415 [Phytohabitans sp. LJ34]|uniref:hypothetical protein n=1 Tax=Phytohabitans sp. LJ34 TaxID=3452217 RepID=UPI003F8B29AB